MVPFGVGRGIGRMLRDSLSSIVITRGSEDSHSKGVATEFLSNCSLSSRHQIAEALVLYRLAVYCRQKQQNQRDRLSLLLLLGIKERGAGGATASTTVKIG